MTKKEVRNETLLSIASSVEWMKNCIENDNFVVARDYGHEALGKMLLTSGLGAINEEEFDYLNHNIVSVTYGITSEERIAKAEELIKTISAWRKR